MRLWVSRRFSFSRLRIEITTFLVVLRLISVLQFNDRNFNKIRDKIMKASKYYPSFLSASFFIWLALVPDLAFSKSNFDKTKILAEQGIAANQNNLGVMYAEGLGKQRDLKQADLDYNVALEWFNKAAGQGLAVAEYNLGVMYNYYLGVRANRSKAIEWYQKSADHGYALAQYNLGFLAENDKARFTYFQNAADQGLALAQVNLGLIYANGDGVVADIKMAKKFFQDAADQGNKDAKNLLNKLKRPHKGNMVCPSNPKFKICGPNNSLVSIKQ
jgi:TPR repeat protein